jgi:hypothetical protein
MRKVQLVRRSRRYAGTIAFSSTGRKHPSQAAITDEITADQKLTGTTSSLPLGQAGCRRALREESSTLGPVAVAIGSPRR